jgi:ribosomal protein L24E
MDDHVDVNRALMLDGNAVAGTLREIFTMEMTVSVAECASCGCGCQVGSLWAFVRGPGIVLRSPKCENIMLRVTRTPDRVYLDARGAAYLCLPLPASEA